jgi:hypothetical protein
LDISLFGPILSGLAASILRMLNPLTLHRDFKGKVTKVIPCSIIGRDVYRNDFPPPVGNTHSSEYSFDKMADIALAWVGDFQVALEDLI